MMEMFWNYIVTGDEMWVHYAEPETKAQSKQWKQADSHPPKKFKLSPSAGKLKVMLVAFLWGFTWKKTDSIYAKSSNCDC